MNCVHCGTKMQMTAHLTFIEECPECGACYDVFHGKEVEREWVYPFDVPQSVPHYQEDFYDIDEDNE